MNILKYSNLTDKIVTVRGYKVILDFDLAELYLEETRTLNQAVKRNIKRFPPDFMFRLTKDEWEIMSSQIVMTSQFVMTSRAKRPKSALPYAFTEHGVTMAASVLKSDIAIEASIIIVRAFVAMRNMLSIPENEIKELQNEVKKLKQYIEESFADYNDINEDTRIQLELINETLAELQVKNRELNKPRTPIGFRVQQ